MKMLGLAAALAMVLAQTAAADARPILRGSHISSSHQSFNTRHSYQGNHVWNNNWRNHGWRHNHHHYYGYYGYNHHYENDYGPGVACYDDGYWHRRPYVIFPLNALTPPWGNC